MKFLSIGDIHGLDVWKGFEDIPQLLGGIFSPDYDKYIFVGDYVDSFKKSNQQILDNLLNIINFKRRYPQHVILLWGNHDIQYLTSYKEHGCSGFRPEAYYDLHEVFRTNRKLFQLAYQHENYLWTHAGIHKGWYEYEFPYKAKNIAQDLNQAFEEGVSSIFDVGMHRGGFKRVGGPLWACRKETWKKPLEGYHQIVGHTRNDKLLTNKINENTSITYIDFLEDDNINPYILEI